VVPKFLNPIVASATIDLQKTELQNARVQNLGTPPSSPVTGQLYYSTAADATLNKLYYWNGSAWIATDGSSISFGNVTAQTTFGAASNNGAASTASRSDHVHGTPAHGAGQHVVGTEITVAAPAIVLGTAAAAGAAASLIRSDATILAFDVTVPSTSSVGQAAAVGSATVAARRDHVHGREAFGTTQNGTAFGTSFADGAATTLARGDHQHGTPAHAAAAHSAIKLSDLAAATADYSMGGFKLTNVAVPVATTDAATKGYVDGVATGLDVKASCKMASTATIAGTYTATGGTSGRGQFTAMGNTAIDGVALVANDRILVKDQSTGAQNGIYVITTVGSGANGVWDRAGDFDTDAEVTAGAFTFVEQGTVNGDSGWVLTTDNPITIGGASGTSLTFAQFSGAGQIAAGAGLTKTGNTLDVGAGTGISVAADAVSVDTAVVVRKYATSIGDGSTLNYVVTHNLNTQDVTIGVRDNSSPYAFMYPDMEATTVNTATIKFAVAPTTNQYRVICHA
jgi:hypothetical protein